MLAKEPPDHFVPLVPVRVAGTGSLRLQRSRVPRAADASGVRTTGALGAILEPSKRLLLHEEEVSRAGLRVTRSFQLARTPDGGVHLWMGRRRRPGRGDRSGAVSYDLIDGRS